MGYANTVISVEFFTPSDDIVASNDASKNVPNLGYLTLVKEIALFSNIHPLSTFRFHFEGAETGGGTNKGRIYRNGVPIGTLSASFPGGGGFTSYDEDIVATNWEVGDKVQLYAQADNAGAQVRNFRIEGIGSLWSNTVV